MGIGQKAEWERQFAPYALASLLPGHLPISRQVKRHKRSCENFSYSLFQPIRFKALELSLPVSDFPPLAIFIVVYAAREWCGIKAKDLAEHLHRDPSMISRLHAAYMEKRDKRTESELQRRLNINATTLLVGEVSVLCPELSCAECQAFYYYRHEPFVGHQFADIQEVEFRDFDFVDAWQLPFRC